MRAAVLVLAAFCLLALVHVSVARVHAKHGKRDLAKTEVSPREAQSHPNSDDEDEEKAEGLIPVQPAKTDGDEDDEGPEGSKKAARKQRKKQRKARKQERKEKNKEEVEEKKKTRKEKRMEMKKRKQQRKQARKERKDKKKEKMMAKRMSCMSDADCPDSCCLKKKGLKKKFCSKPIARTETQNCKRSCQCKSDLACFIENQPSSPRHRRKAMGVCANPDAVDLSKGYILDRKQY